MKELETGLAILAARTIYDTKQRAAYIMRHDGIPRLNKPFPTAADAHFPLIDMQIGDLKPFWVSQMWGGDRLTDFVSWRPQLDDLSEAAADYFNSYLRYFTRLAYESNRMVDTMLMRARGVLHAVTNPYKDHRIEVENIDPQYILMSGDFDDFWDADEWLWVQHLSVDQYRRNRNFKQNDDNGADIVDRIKGRRDGRLETAELEKRIIEGITTTINENKIILWNHYRRTGAGFVVKTFSPIASDLVLREPYTEPYEIDGEPSRTFYSFTMEIKDFGWYAPRSIVDLNASFELWASKCWNHQVDWLTFSGTPLFTNDGGPIPNMANMPIKPGDFLPGNVRTVQFPNAGVEFEQQIQFARDLGSQRARTPDFGQFSPDRTESGKPITATQSKITAGLQAVGADYNGDIFRNTRLMQFYRHLWCLMLHGAKQRQINPPKPSMAQPDPLAYFAGQQVRVLPLQALHDAYLILPAGGTANKQERTQRALMRFQLLKGMPNVNQDELVKNLLNADDARLTPKILVPQDTHANDEYFDQVIDINAAMVDGFPAPIKPQQDHVARIKASVDWIHKQAATGAPPNPVAMQTVMGQIQARVKILEQQNPDALKQLAQILNTIHGPQQQQLPPNAAPMPQQPMESAA